MVPKRVEIFTDGACRGNPGPGGWGAVLLYEGHQKRIKGSVAYTTNNRMELMAAIEALSVLKSPCVVGIHTDSQYVKKGMTEWIALWKKKGWRTSGGEAVKNVDLWQALDSLTQKHSVTWHWVKGHNGDPHNELADSLARDAIDS